MILAGNHTGYLDSLVVLAAVSRPFHFLMTHNVFGWHWVGRLVPYGNIIPIQPGREKRSLVETMQRLKRGGAICIFPEGRLTPDGQLLEFNPGVAYLQEKSARPIIPFAICGGYEAWPEGRPFPRFIKIALVFGEPIMPGTFQDREQVTQAVKSRIANLLGQASGFPTSG